MQEICVKAEELANAILRGAGFSLQASVSETEQGCLVSIDGPDNGLLLNQGGELLDALQQIPPEQREAVVLSKVEGWSFEEIASLRGISVGAARLRAHRGYEKLRGLLGGLGEA